MTQGCGCHAELPAPVLASLATFAAFPGSMRNVASVDLGGASASIDLPSSYGATLTLRYRGATSADEAAIAAAGGIVSLPRPYEVHVVPTLEVDGVERARGEALLPGQPQDVAVTVSSPNAGSSIERHHVFAGAVFALAFPVGLVPDALAAAKEAALDRAVAEGKKGDDLEAARASRALWRYFWTLHRDTARALGPSWIRAIVGVSEGIAGAQPEADLLYDVPVAIRRDKYVIDVPRAGWTPYSVDGDDGPLVGASALAQWQGSAWEHRIWEQTLNGPAISTVRVLQVARQQGLQVLSLDGSSASLVDALPYSAGAK